MSKAPPWSSSQLCVCVSTVCVRVARLAGPPPTPRLSRYLVHLNPRACPHTHVYIGTYVCTCVYLRTRVVALTRVNYLHTRVVCTYVCVCVYVYTCTPQGAKHGQTQGPRARLCPTSLWPSTSTWVAWQTDLNLNFNHDGETPHRTAMLTYELPYHEWERLDGEYNAYGSCRFQPPPPAQSGEAAATLDSKHLEWR
jgi:hypothetical protein